MDARFPIPMALFLSSSVEEGVGVRSRSQFNPTLHILHSSLRT
jgi:hypothetical protein